MENFCLHTSTSPQYPMIASLDVARKQMVMEGYSLLSRALELSDTFRDSVNSLKKFRVLELPDLIAPELRDDRVRLDRTKITIDISASGYNSKEVEYLLLNKHSIQIEKTTFNTITVLITIGSTLSKLNRLFLAFEDIEKKSGRQEVAENGMIRDFKLALSPLKFRPRPAFYAESEKINLNEATDRISAAMIVPYPPGIPLLVPGQIITTEIVAALRTYREYGVEIHGLHDGVLNVLTLAEEARLSRESNIITPLD
jgi:arginine/lysine/ornithine decarboxylase